MVAVMLYCFHDSRSVEPRVYHCWNWVPSIWWYSPTVMTMIRNSPIVVISVIKVGGWSITFIVTVIPSIWRTRWTCGNSWWRSSSTITSIIGRSIPILGWARIIAFWVTMWGVIGIPITITSIVSWGTRCTCSTQHELVHMFHFIKYFAFQAKSDPLIVEVRCTPFQHVSIPNLLIYSAVSQIICKTNMICFSYRKDVGWNLHSDFFLWVFSIGNISSLWIHAHILKKGRHGHIV